MKKILIISPHFPPSNLASVHRSRLFAQHLPSFGWEPTILTVHEDYYEEKLDRNLEKLVRSDLRVIKVKAFKIKNPRFIGDIGLRGFFQLYEKAKKLIKIEKFDFLYIPIPPFYISLLGRMLNITTGIKYGIDYIDPWVHNFPGSNIKFSRHWFSSKIAKVLEPIAIRKATLITGVAKGYYKGIIERNREIASKIIFGAMPYGGEEKDHQAVRGKGISYLLKKNGKIQLVYAGAMLPKSYAPLETIMNAINKQKNEFKNIEIHFIGSGKIANDQNSFNIKEMAIKHNLWETVFFEHPARIPYLDVLIHLDNADGAFILGSTESHYTPSKVYQAVLSGKYIFAVLHKESTASDFIIESKAGNVLAFSGEKDLITIERDFVRLFSTYLSDLKLFNRENVNKEIFNKYSAYSVTESLANLLNKCTE